MPTLGVSTVAVLLVSVFITGCVRRDGRNSDCKWPGESHPKTLDPTQRDDAGHLRQDVEFAEELAVEYMDVHHGRAASQALNACRSELIEQIGKSHNVSPGEVRKFLGARSRAADAAVILPFLVLYGFFAGTFAARLLCRYPLEDGWTVTLIMVILSSFVFGIAGTMLGEAWSAVAESIRVGNGHLSYRSVHLPWARHHVEAFVLCLVLFWGVAASRYRLSQVQPPQRQHRLP